MGDKGKQLHSLDKPALTSCPLSSPFFKPWERTAQFRKPSPPLPRTALHCLQNEVQNTLGLPYLSSLPSQHFLCPCPLPPSVFLMVSSLGMLPLLSTSALARTLPSLEYPVPMTASLRASRPYYWVQLLPVLLSQPSTPPSRHPACCLVLVPCWQ